MTEFRTIDSSGNYPSNLGVLNTDVIRLFLPAYDDGISVPRGGLISEFDPFTQTFVDASDLPNPRTISNIISDETEFVPNFLNINDFFVPWTQFLGHDFALTVGNADTPQPPAEDFIPIVVPQDDPTDPFVQNSVPFLPFSRIPAAPGTGVTTPRQQLNRITSFIDASTVYGSDAERAAFLRSFEQGQLKTTVGDNGEILLPFNTSGLPNDSGGFPIPPEQLYVAGELRVNGSTSLTAFHTLFVREHNHLASEIQERLLACEEELFEQFEDFAEDYLETKPGANPIEIEDEFLYQSARQVVGAQMQLITYSEFLPLLIGETLLDDYNGYDPTVDPSLGHEFLNGLTYMGHTISPNQRLRINGEGISETPANDIVFNPSDITANGIDSLLQGSIFKEVPALDNMVVDSLRNNLIPSPSGPIGLDLAALTISRGREVGIPSYVEIYNSFFPKDAILDFDALPFAPEIVDLFAATYSDVSEIDLSIAGVSELPGDHGGLLGPTLTILFQDQFTRFRDGDRFFFLEENQLEQLQTLDPEFLDTTFADIIRRNTNNSYFVPDNVFQVPFDNEIFGDENDNVLNGNNSRDLIEGKEGNDILFGDRGKDILLGNQGDDRLEGGRGKDTLLGGVDNDTLIGDLGDDVLDGGSGQDQYIGGQGADLFVIKPGEGTDTITDFSNLDRIGLTSGVVVSDLSFSGEEIILASTSEVLVTLVGIDTTTLTESDFIIV